MPKNRRENCLQSSAVGFPDGNSISHVELKRSVCMWTLMGFERLRLFFDDLAFVGIGHDRALNRARLDVQGSENAIS
jgi:hypothetical protein